MNAQSSSFRGHLVTAVVALMVATAGFVAFVGIGGGLPVGKSDYRVQVVLPTSATLVRGSRVSMAGTTVGRVTDIGRRGLSTVVTMRIDDDRVTPVPADSRYVLRQRTPVGENYIAVTPGRSKATLPSGGTLSASQSDEYVDVDQILSVLSGPVRDRTRELIQASGGALAGRGEALNRVLGGASNTVQAGSMAFTILDADRDHVAGLVGRLGSIMNDVGERSATVQIIAQQGLKSLQAIAARDGALRRTLEVLPSTLSQVRRTSGRVQSVSASVAPVVADLAIAVRQLRPAITNLRPAAQEGRQLLRQVTATAPGLQVTLDRAAELSDPLTKALPQFKQTLCQANPVIRYVKPYADDIAQLAAGLGSSSNGYDAIGHLIRITPIVNENSLVGLPDNVSQAAHTLLRAGFLSKSMGLTRNPYPKSGRMGKDGAGTGKDVLTAEGLKGSGYVFPRILADC